VVAAGSTTVIVGPPSAVPSCTTSTSEPVSSPYVTPGLFLCGTTVMIAIGVSKLLGTAFGSGL